MPPKRKITHRPLGVSFHPPPKTALIQDQLAVQIATNNLKTESRAKAASLIHYGFDTSVNIVGRLVESLYVTASPVDAVNFLVPPSMVFKLTKIALVFSDPIIAMSDSIGWRITVNNDRVPYITRVPETTIINDYFYGARGSLSEPMKIEPLWIQAGQTVAIRLYIESSHDDHCLIQGNLVGLLFKAGSPAIGRL